MSGGQPRHGWGHRLRELLGGDLLGCRGARDQPGVRSSAQALKRRGACSGGHVKGEGGVRRVHFRRRTAHIKRAHIGRVQIFKNVSRRSAVLTADTFSDFPKNVDELSISANSGEFSSSLTKCGHNEFSTMMANFGKLSAIV